MKYLPAKFYARDSGRVARELLGKLLVRTISGHRVSCRIVETEAYYGSDDPASHAARGKTKRNSVMFGPPGHAYVYFNYGMHYLFNVVTEIEGVAGAVLIRAVEPVEGIELLRDNRQVDKEEDLTSGPAKLTQALGINLEHNGCWLISPELGVAESKAEDFEIVSAARVGISSGCDLAYRYYVNGNRFVSRSSK